MSRTQDAINELELNKKDWKSMTSEEYNATVRTIEEYLQRPICGARTKNKGGRPCMSKPLPKSGRCRFHGGLSTGPRDREKLKNNKNGVKTGEYEKISLNTLSDEEKELYKQLDTDVLERVKHDIKMLQIREVRMMQRISNLLGVDYWNERYESEKGIVKGVPQEMKREIKTDTLRRAQEIEDALTRVQERKTKLFELKHKIESGGQADVDVSVYLDAIKKSTKDAWE